MTVAIKRGDLLRQEVDAIVNTVNTVGIMGKGIALQFKQKWPENFRAYERACREDKVRIGEMFIFDAGGLVKPHYIINFPTKEHWRKRSKIEYIERGLKDLIFQVQRLGIKSIALPPLGCGNGGLPWPEVRERIVRAYEAAPEVEVLLFEPAGAPRPQEQVTRTKRPKMTPGRAAIVEILSIYRQMEYSLTRLEVQKLAYLLERAGQPLDLQFIKHYYGPYSDKARHVLQAMEGHYISGLGDGSTEAEIKLVPSALDASNQFLEDEPAPALRERVGRVAALIRQGADVAMLMRRLRARVGDPDRPPACVGTSATMVSGDDEDDRNQLVAEVASKLFGTTISRDAVVTETLKRGTDPSRSADRGLRDLGVAVDSAASG